MNQLGLIITACLALGACASDADPCTTVDNGDGTYTLNCPDSSPITIRDGMDGMDGMDGTSGTDGMDGTSYLADAADEPAGANCADGGVAISVGPDTNGNGTLDSDEVTATTYACNGANGADGAAGVQTLVTTTDEPAGANCTSGGLRVDSGPDTDGSGVLDSGEITATEYVCDGIGPDGLSMAREFPSATSTLDTTAGGTNPLGTGGGGVTYQAGGNVEETITFDGVTSLDSLTVQFDMDDSTGAGCVVGTLTFDITINGTMIGTYSFPGGNRFDRIQFRESFEFAPIAGTGGTDNYTIRYEANETVCPGGGSYNWFPGGIVQTGL